MKLKLILSTGILAAIVVLSTGAHAADSAAGTSAVEVSVPPAKVIKPHSHAEEKTGLPTQIHEPKEGSTTAVPSAADKKKLHLHPRDGK